MGIKIRIMGKIIEGIIGKTKSIIGSGLTKHAFSHHYRCPSEFTHLFLPYSECTLPLFEPHYQEALVFLASVV